MSSENAHTEDNITNIFLQIIFIWWCPSSNGCEIFMKKSELLKLECFHFQSLLKGNGCENEKIIFFGGKGVGHLDTCLVFIHRGVCFAAG